MTETLTPSEVEARLIQTGDETVVEVDFTPDLVQRAYTRVAREVSRQVEIPGFRRGHAPIALLMNRVGEQQFQEWVAQELVERHWEEIVEQAEIQPPTPRQNDEPSIKVEVDQMEPGEAGRIRLRGPIVHIRLPDLQELEHSYHVPPITSEDVDEALGQFLREHSQVELASRTKVEWGDLVSVEVRVSSQGKVLIGEEQPEQLMLEMGRHQYTPDLDPILHGAERNVPKTVVVNFPDDHPNQEIQGRPAEVTVKVIDIFEIQHPELDEDFLQEHFNVQSEEQARQVIADRLERVTEQMAIAEARSQLVERVVDAAQISLPADELEQQTQDELSRAQEQIRQGNQPFEGSEEELEQAVRNAVRRRMTREYLLDHIADREKLRPSENELASALEYFAQRTGTSPEQIMASAEENREIGDSLYLHARRRMAADFIFAEAQVRRESEPGEEEQDVIAEQGNEAAPGEDETGS